MAGRRGVGPFAEAVVGGLRLRLGPPWSVRSVGAGLVVSRRGEEAVVDLLDLAARHPHGVIADDLDGIAACVRRQVEAPPTLAAAGERLLPCLWTGAQLPAPLGLVRRPWQDPVWIGYGVQGDRCTFAVTSADLRAWDADAAAVDQRAMGNLQRGDGAVSRVVAGVLYAFADAAHPERSAAQVLAPGALERLARRCGVPAFLVALPHRGLAILLRAPRGDDPDRLVRARWDRTRAIARRQYREALGPLTDAFFAWEQGRWTAPRGAAERPATASGAPPQGALGLG